MPGLGSSGDKPSDGEVSFVFHGVGQSDGRREGDRHANLMDQAFGMKCRNGCIYSCRDMSLRVLRLACIFLYQ